jgi:hypothetical protein
MKASLIQATLLRNANREPLSKSFSLKDGKLNARTAAEMVAGTFETTEFAHIDDFADSLINAGYDPTCAYAYGVNSAAHGFVASLDKIADGKARRGAVARTNANFPYRIGLPGVLLLDFDPQKGCEFETAYEHDRRLADLVPWWPDLRRHYVSSSSSAIYDSAGKLLSKRAGWHGYVVLDDASRAKAILDQIFAALIDGGHGSIHIAGHGAKLLRAPIDRNVSQGSRLDFAFGGQCSRGLSQRRETIPMGHAEILATGGLGLADFDRWKASSVAVSKLMADAEPEARETRAKWVDLRLDDAVQRGANRQVARKQYERALSRNELPADFTLYSVRGEAITVGELLANPDRYDRMRFCDPLEPNYGSGDACAVAFLRGQHSTPALHSHAHGGQTFKLLAPEPARRNIAVATVNPSKTEQVPPMEGSNVVPVDFAPVDPDGRPVIKIFAGGLAIMADRAEQHLGDASVPLFTRSNAIVRPIIVNEVDSIGNATRHAAIAEVDQPFMRDVLSREISWLTARKEKDGGVDWVPSHPPRDVVETIMARQGLWKFRSLAGVISTPTLRPDGSVLDKPGYDETTKLYLFETVKLPSMPMHPTQYDAEEALALLDALLDDFPFISDEDGATPSRSVALSLLISPTVRGCMDVAPAHVVRASTAGSGKSYLVDTSSAIALGSRAAVMSAGETQEETEKRIGAQALVGRTFIFIDNVNGELGGDLLCQLVERPVCEIRILGRSTMPRIQNKFTVVVTGNNVSLIGDMTRRALICSIDPQMERPETREFSGDPVQAVLRNRALYIAACLTVVRAYILAGSPKQDCAPMASFGMWSNTVRSALLWLGRADPCNTISAARDEDPVLQRLNQFLGALRQDIGTGKNVALLAADMEAKANAMAQHVDENGYSVGEKFQKHPLLAAAIAEWTHGGKVNTKSLGKWLNRNKLRVVDGHRLACFEDKHKKQLRWYAEKIDGQGTSHAQ